MENSKTTPNPLPSIESLAHLNPFVDLDQATLQNIAKLAETLVLPKGDVLFQVEDIDFFTYYLISGGMELLTKDGRIQTLNADDDNAKNPISTLIPRQYTARATTEITVLKFNTDTLNFTMYGDGHSGLVANTEIEDDLTETGEFEGEIFSEIFRGISTGNTYTPPLPGSVLRVLNLINTNEMSFYQLEMALQHDPQNVQTLIDIANSDLYTSEEPAEDLKQAVSVMSYRDALLWLLSITIKPVFQARTETMQVQVSNLWIQSAYVATIAAILARKTRLFNPAQAFLCGLMQDIGTLPIYCYLDQKHHKQKKPHRIEKAVSDLRAELGAMLLDKWSIPNGSNQVAREVENWSRNPSDKAELVDLILIAKLHTYLQFPSNKPIPPMFKLPAFKKLGLRTYGPANGMDMLDEAKSKLLDVFKLLPESE